MTSPPVVKIANPPKSLPSVATGPFVVNSMFYSVVVVIDVESSPVMASASIGLAIIAAIATIPPKIIFVLVIDWYKYQIIFNFPVNFVVVC